MSDIELALTKYPVEAIEALRARLPPNYVLDAKYDIGWGAVIRIDSNLPDDIDDAINEFMNGLDSIIGDIRTSSSVLRIAVFNKNATFTFRMQSLDTFTRFAASIELSIYPSTD